MLGLTAEEWQSILPVLGKLGVAALLAGIIGWEREMHGRPAGVRTHMLMALGVVLFCESSKMFGGDQGRIAAQVVTGVGFLGAGTILRMGPEIKGLTTAASLWATSGISMVVSVGGAFIVVAIAAALLSLFTLVTVDRIENRFLKDVKSKMLHLTLDERSDVLELLQYLSTFTQLKVRSVQVHQSDPDIVIDVELRGETDNLLESVAAMKGVRHAAWQ